MSYKIIKLEKIQTKEGYMFPIYRNWDSSHNNHIPKMVYATTINNKVEKDIILHKHRTTFLTCIKGEVSMELLVDNEIIEIILNGPDFESPNILLLEPDIPFKIKNNSNDEAVLINCPSPSWHPEKQDTFKFKSWEEYKNWLE